MTADERKLEALSALIDGEISVTDSAVVDELLHDDGMRRAWGRYHLISDVMQNAMPEHVDRHLAERIGLALRHEPVLLLPQVSARRALLRPLAGLAIAASVAAMAVMGIQYGRDDVERPSGAELAATAAPGTMQAASGGHVNLAAGSSPGRREFTGTAPGYSSARMDRYLVNYNEYRRSAAMQGMLPYVRIVADEQDQ